MKRKVLLIGVDHTPIHLDEVVTFLEKRNVSNKKVMIETSSYPLPLRYYERNPSYCEFYDGLYQYLHKRDSCIIHGDSEELIEKAYENICNLWKTCMYGDWGKEYKKIVCGERDHHFYKVYKKHHPEIIILDSWHTLYLRKRIHCEYRRIPKKNSS